MSTHRRRMHRRWRRARAAHGRVVGIVEEYIRASLARGLESFVHSPRSPIDDWRMMAAAMRLSGDGRADFLDAAIRCAETNEPQHLPHGTITYANPTTGAIHFTPNAVLERISLTLDVGPSPEAP